MHIERTIGQSLLANFDGTLIDCETIEHMQFIQWANEVLERGETDSCTPTELRRLAGVLNHYNRHAEAAKLMRLAGQLSPYL